jgi:hypothetical protein
MRENASGLAAPFEHEDDDEHEDESNNPREKTRNPTIVPGLTFSFKQRSSPESFRGCCQSQKQ